MSAPEPAARSQIREPAGPFTRFLWACAGADPSVLQRCPYTDGVKFQGVGGVVLATAVLAAASGSYAFYTVFEPKSGMALARETHFPTLLMALAAGVVWGLVIFNIDRFIVSSTGKGDGTEKITLREFGQALPRLIMAVLLGVCIAKPLEIRILKPEIDAQLELEQNEYLTRLNAHSEQMFQGVKEDLRARIAEATGRLDEAESYFERRRIEINAQRRSLELEAEGRTGSGKAGRGPAWRDKKDTLDQMMTELDRDRVRAGEKNQSVEGEIARWKGELDGVDSKLDAAMASNLEQARHLDGLMKRIQISHDIGGWVPIVILLLLLAIETGPIFFKMMLVRGAYDYLLENEMRLATARAGVEIGAQVYLPDTQEEVRLDIYHQAEAAFDVARGRIASGAAGASAASTRPHGEGRLRPVERGR